MCCWFVCVVEMLYTPVVRFQRNSLVLHVRSSSFCFEFCVVTMCASTAAPLRVLITPTDLSIISNSPYKIISAYLILNIRLWIICPSSFVKRNYLVSTRGVMLSSWEARIVGVTLRLSCLSPNRLRSLGEGGETPVYAQ